MKKYWRNRDEDKVRKEIKEHPEKILALEYLAWADADSYVLFDSIEEYEEYKKIAFKSIYSGWITTDFDKSFLERSE